MNFSGISDKSLIGKALRFPLHFLPREAVVPILQGDLRGKRWVVSAYDHGCWLGSYESDKQHLFGQTIKPNSVVFDIGANVGFYSLLAATLVGATGKVFSFEPFPRNIRYLKKHLQLNRVTNVTIFEAAVADIPGTSYFKEGETFGMGHLSNNGGIEVSVVSIDDLIDNGKLPLPDYIKMDIEGGEVLALQGARKMLASHHPTIFLATHGQAIHQESCALLASLGYDLQPIDGKSLMESDELLAVASVGRRAS